MENDIYSAPESDLETPGEVGDDLSSRGKRFVAAIIDTIITLPFSIGLLYFTGGLEVFMSGEEPAFTYSLALGIANILFFIVVHGYLLLNYGQTVGKRALSIKIVTIDREKAELGSLVKRYAFYFGLALIPVAGSVLGLINVLFIFSKSKRCLHDLVAKTCVVTA